MARESQIDRFLIDDTQGSLLRNHYIKYWQKTTLTLVCAWVYMISGVDKCAKKSDSKLRQRIKKERQADIHLKVKTSV